MSISEIQTRRVFEESAPLVLSSSETLAPIDVAYQSMGTISPKKDNVILLCHALTGDSQFAGTRDDGSPGWWNNLVGPGKAIDTDRYFVICPAVLGTCHGSTGPASLNPKTGSAYARDFPMITIEDMVRCQQELLRQLGITKLYAVIGGSMGGMQALSWAALFPDMVQRCIPIASTAQVSPLAIAFDAVARQAILSVDSPGCEGLSTARMLGHITYLSDVLMDHRFGRSLQDREDYSYTFDSDFQVESYLNYKGRQFAERFDEATYLYLTRAVSYFDMEKEYGSLQAAFEKSTARFLVISIRSDWLYTPEQSKQLVHSLMKLNKNVSYIDIDSHYGHDSFLIDNRALEESLYVFLESRSHVT